MGTYLLEGRNHDIWTVVDREDDISDTSSSQALDLVEDHRTVGKLDQWLGESESLSSESASGRVFASNWRWEARCLSQLFEREGPLLSIMPRTNGLRRVPKPPTRIKAIQTSAVDRDAADERRRGPAYPSWWAVGGSF